MPEVPLHTDTQHVEHQHDEDSHGFWTAARRRQIAWALVVLLVIVLLAVVPPLISISRYQRRVASSISESLGRPVHFDNLSLHLLPLPGITIQNFVVGETPEFGAEPVMRANSVEARLRVGSIFRRRIEVSSIILESPSINLVRRRSDGAWNLQGILMRASQMNSAPTAQAKAGPAPRFPYIEATDARLNIKSSNDKLPFAIKEADLALWLPEPDEWHLRITGRPVRTDTDVSDVGLIHLEATLGRATDLASAPIDLNASWKPTPLGETGKLTVGYDLGWRGEASAEATLKGTLGHAKLVTDLHLLAIRRADFVPAHTAELNAHCEATTGGLLRSLSDVRCAIPTSNDTSIFSAIEGLRRLPAPTGDNGMPDATVKPGVLFLRGDVPNILDPHTISLQASLQDASPDYALAWARLFSRRIPQNFSVGGTFSLTASTAAKDDDPGKWTASIACKCILPPRKPASGEDAPKAPKTPTENRWTITLQHGAAPAPSAPNTLALFAYANPSEAGKPEPAIPVIPSGSLVTGQISLTGYDMVYGSPKIAEEIVALLPPLGDNMPTGPTGPLEAHHLWASSETTWPATQQPTPLFKSRHRR